MATITRRGDSWFAQVRRKGFAARYKSFKRQADARTWAREQELAIDAGSAPTERQAGLTLGRVLERYKQEISSRKRGRVSEIARIGKMQKAPIAALSLDSLSPAAVAAYRDDRLCVVKPGTVRRELAILHHVVETASKEWGLYGNYNPVARIARPVVRDQRDRRVDPQELERLRAALNRMRNRIVPAVVEFALATAMRRSEILNLRWTHVDLQKRVARVPESKNGFARTVPLSQAATAILHGQPRSHERVFPTSADAVKNAWNRVRQQALVRDLRFHDLRHEAISQFFERGLSVAEVCHISGHRDLRMLSRYTHLRSEDIAKKI